MKFILALVLIIGFVWYYNNGSNRPAAPEAGVASTSPPRAAQPPEKTPEQKRAEEADELKFQQDVRAVRVLKASMKNPASFSLEEAIRMDNGTLCLSYRATNSFNAIVPGQAVIIKTAFYTSETDGFSGRWTSQCAKKLGVSVKHIKWAL